MDKKRMRKLALIALTACIACAMAAYAQNAVDRSTELKLTVLERLLRVQGFSSKDLNTLERLLGPDFVLVTERGASKNRDEALAYLQSLDSVRYATEEIMVRVHGDTSVVTGLYQMTGVQNGTPFVRRGRFVDTWLFKDGNWSLTASVSIPAL